MNQLITLITAIIFFYMGKYSRTEKEKLIINDIIKKAKSKGIPTVITYPTREETEYDGSEREKIDGEIEKNLKAKGLE